MPTSISSGAGLSGGSSNNNSNNSSSINSKSSLYSSSSPSPSSVNYPSKATPHMHNHNSNISSYNMYSSSPRKSSSSSPVGSLPVPPCATPSSSSSSSSFPVVLAILPPLVSTVFGTRIGLDLLLFLVTMVWLYLVIKKPEELYDQAKENRLRRMQLMELYGSNSPVARGDDSSSSSFSSLDAEGTGERANKSKKFQGEMERLRNLEFKFLMLTFASPFIGGLGLYMLSYLSQSLVTDPSMSSASSQALLGGAADGGVSSSLTGTANSILSSPSLSMTGDGSDHHMMAGGWEMTSSAGGHGAQEAAKMAAAAASAGLAGMQDFAAGCSSDSNDGVENNLCNSKHSKKGASRERGILDGDNHGAGIDNNSGTLLHKLNGHEGPQYHSGEGGKWRDDGGVENNNVRTGATRSSHSRQPLPEENLNGARRHGAPSYSNAREGYEHSNFNNQNNNGHHQQQQGNTNSWATYRLFDISFYNVVLFVMTSSIRPFLRLCSRWKEEAEHLQDVIEYPLSELDMLKRHTQKLREELAAAQACRKSSNQDMLKVRQDMDVLRQENEQVMQKVSRHFKSERVSCKHQYEHSLEKLELLEQRLRDTDTRIAQNLVIPQPRDLTWLSLFRREPVTMKVYRLIWLVFQKVIPTIEADKAKC
eukprot:Nk52_evm3s77 gene=Nk52_evmTU3s77